MTPYDLTNTLSAYTLFLAIVGLLILLVERLSILDGKAFSRSAGASQLGRLRDAIETTDSVH